MLGQLMETRLLDMKKHQGRKDGHSWETPWEFPSHEFQRLSCSPHEGVMRSSLDIPRKVPHQPIIPGP